MDAATFIAAVGLVTTLLGAAGAPLLANRQAAKHAERAELRSERLKLYAEMSLSMHASSYFLAWLTEPYRLQDFAGVAVARPARELTGRVLLLAPTAIVEAWQALWVVSDSFDWYINQELESRDHYGAQTVGDDPQVVRMQAAIDRVQALLRMAAGADEL